MPSSRSRRTRELAKATFPRLRSGREGDGGRFAPNNGHPELAPKVTSFHEGRQVAHYRVIGTTSSYYSTSVAGNETMIWRDER